MSQRAVQGHEVLQFGVYKSSASSVAASLFNNVPQCIKSSRNSLHENIGLDSCHALFYTYNIRENYTIYLKTLYTVSLYILLRIFLKLSQDTF